MATFLNTINGVTIYRSERRDDFGNPRAIVHFFNFLTDRERAELSVTQGYERAHERAKRAGFRKYTAREFGGGFICQYDYCEGVDIAKRVLQVRPQE